MLSRLAETVPGRSRRARWWSAGSARRRSAPWDARRRPAPSRRSPRKRSLGSRSTGALSDRSRGVEEIVPGPALALGDRRCPAGRGTTREIRRACRRRRPAARLRPARTSSGSGRGTPPREPAAARSRERRIACGSTLYSMVLAYSTPTSATPPAGARGAERLEAEPAPRGRHRIDRAIGRKALRRHAPPGSRSRSSSARTGTQQDKLGLTNELAAP